MDYQQEDRMVVARLEFESHEHVWLWDSGDMSVGIPPGWYCDYYNEELHRNCDELPSAAEQDELEAFRYGEIPVQF